jgi:hypothetical protein
VKKNDAVCESCLPSVISLNFKQTSNPDITKLLTLKEYCSGSLLPGNQAAFDLILAAETVFHNCSLHFLIVKAMRKNGC